MQAEIISKVQTSYGIRQCSEDVNHESPHPINRWMGRRSSGVQTVTESALTLAVNRTCTCNSLADPSAAGYQDCRSTSIR